MYPVLTIVDMIYQILVFVLYQIVSCLFTNKKVNKHHNSHCLKTRISDPLPHLAFDFQTIAFLTMEVRFPLKAHSFHCGQFSFIRSPNLKCLTTDENYYLRSSNFLYAWFKFQKPLMRDLPHCKSSAIQL